jgi:hypothetical protein
MSSFAHWCVQASTPAMLKLMKSNENPLTVENIESQQKTQA